MQTASHVPVLLQLAQRANALPLATAVALMRALASALGRLPEEQVLYYPPETVSLFHVTNYRPCCRACLCCLGWFGEFIMISSPSRLHSGRQVRARTGRCRFELHYKYDNFFNMSIGLK